MSSLHEKKERIGGNIIPGGTPDFKEDDHLLAKWYEQETGRFKSRSPLKQ